MNRMTKKSKERIKKKEYKEKNVEKIRNEKKTGDG
jgi:hypothetical protein